MVGIFLADGFEEIEALTVCDLLRRKRIDVRLVSIYKEKRVKGAHGIEVACDETIEDFSFEKSNMLVLPGGMPGTNNLQDCQMLTNEITKANEEGKWICAICAAPKVLGSLGILKGKKCTIYPGMEEYLIGGKALKDEVVIDGNIITSRGPGKAMAFALKIVEVLTDIDTRKKLEKDLVL